MILVPSYGKYEIITAEPRLTFRQCMAEAQHYNDAIDSKSFAVCMPTIHEKLSQDVPKKHGATQVVDFIILLLM